MQELQQLQQENATLEIKIKELSHSQELCEVKHNELLQLRKDMQMLQQSNEVNNSKLNQLEQENETLRSRLRNMVQSPLSESEKTDSQHRQHNSAPASISMTLPNVCNFYFTFFSDINLCTFYRSHFLANTCQQ
jgi:cytospin